MSDLNSVLVEGKITKLIEKDSELVELELASERRNQKVSHKSNISIIRISVASFNSDVKKLLKQGGCIRVVGYISSPKRNLVVVIAEHVELKRTAERN